MKSAYLLVVLLASSLVAGLVGSPPATGGQLTPQPVNIKAVGGSTIAAGGSIPVSMGAVPTGGATAAKQDTGNTSLASILATAGATTDAKSTATDATAVSMMQVLKEISAMEQAPASRAVTNAGTFAVQGAGDVANNSSDSGNPLKIGAVAVSAEPTVATNGQRANLSTDLSHKLITLPYANPENFLNGSTSAITTTGQTAIIAAQSAGVRIFVTSLTVTNSHASVGTLVTIQDGNTTIWLGYAAPAGGGFTITFPTPLRGTAATALNATCGTSGANVYVSAAGYKGS